MKRILTIVLVILSCFIGISMNAYADGSQEFNESIEDILNNLNLEELQNYLDANKLSYSFGQNAREMIEYLLQGDLSVNYSNFIKDMLEKIFSNVLKLLPSLSQIMAVSILCAIVSGSEGSIISKNTAETVRLVCYSFIVLIISSIVVQILASATDCIMNIKRQIEIITPILVTLTVLTGGNGGAAIYQPSALFLSGGAIELISGIIFPVTVTTVILDCLGSISSKISFDGTVKLLKNAMKWVMGITVTVFSLFITVQSSASSLFDGIFFKATKYLVGNSVPIVGGFLSAGVDMLVGAGSVIKSSVGVLGIVLLLSEIIEPIVLLLSFSLMLKLLGAFVQPIGEKGLFSLYSSLSSDTEYFVAGILTVAFMYFLIVMLIINSAVGFV